jgi:outer membrane translocation and assembly module TamA
MDRFLGKLAVLTNTEVRFPVYKRLGGVGFFDAGTTAASAEHFRWTAFHVSPGIGLRFIFDTFVVRADIGFSSEGGGVYLNFGQMF